MRQLVAAAISKPADRTARHLGRLVRDARLARKMPQSELALRAKTSIPTVRRIEGGAPETSLGIYVLDTRQLFSGDESASRRVAVLLAGGLLEHGHGGSPVCLVVTTDFRGCNREILLPTYRESRGPYHPGHRLRID